MSPFDDFVLAIELATGRPGKRQGGQVRLLCPAHDDHGPSLDVKEGDGGKPLVQCRSRGCTFEDIARAIGFEREEADPALWTPRGPAITVYAYHDAKGELVQRVSRTADKQFPQSWPDPSKRHGWRFSRPPGFRPVLYRLPEVVAAVESGMTIHVCEGEKDVEAVRRVGGIATCNPGGAGKWRREYAQMLSGAAKVVVIADRDEPGLDHASTVVKSLRDLVGSTTVFWAREGKDAADHLAAGLTLADLVPAEVPDAEEEILPLDEFLSQHGDPQIALLGEEDAPILVGGGFHMLAGKPGVGKTTLVIDAAMHLVSGLNWLDFNVPRPLNVLMIENEGPREMFRRKLERKRNAWRHTIRGQLMIWVWRWGKFDFAHEEHRDMLRAQIEKHAIDMVIADSLGGIGAPGPGSPEEVVAFTDLLRDVGFGYDTAYWVLHHLRKEPTSDEIDEVAGAWGKETDATLLLKLTHDERFRLSFPKLRWAERREAVILAPDETREGFVLVGTERDKRHLESEILKYLAAHDKEWFTAGEIAAPADKGGIGARRDSVSDVLTTLVEAGEVVRETGPGGRGNRAVCYCLTDSLAHLSQTTCTVQVGVTGELAQVRGGNPPMGVPSPGTSAPLGVSDD